MTRVPPGEYLAGVLQQRGPQAVPYQDAARPTVKDHLVELQKVFPSLSISVKEFHSNDGRSHNLLQAAGTIPIHFQGNKYNIPVCIWLPENYPYQAPISYVMPTQNMIIKPGHRFVDRNGEVGTPSVRSWRFPNNNLVELALEMSQMFGQEPPLFSQPGTNPQPSLSTASAASAAAASGAGLGPGSQRFSALNQPQHPPSPPRPSSQQQQQQQAQQQPSVVQPPPAYPSYGSFLMGGLGRPMVAGQPPPPPPGGPPPPPAPAPGSAAAPAPPFAPNYATPMSGTNSPGTATPTYSSYPTIGAPAPQPGGGLWGGIYSAVHGHPQQQQPGGQASQPPPPPPPAEPPKPPPPRKEDLAEAFRPMAVAALRQQLLAVERAHSKHCGQETNAQLELQRSLMERRAQLSAAVDALKRERSEAEGAVQEMSAKAQQLRQWIERNEPRAAALGLLQPPPPSPADGGSAAAAPAGGPPAGPSAAAAAGGALNVGQALVPADELSRQTLEAQAQDLAIEDTILALDKALQNGTGGITVDQYLRQVRMLSHRQFFHRLTGLKVAEAQQQMPSQAAQPQPPPPPGAAVSRPFPVAHGDSWTATQLLH